MRERVRQRLKRTAGDRAEAVREEAEDEEDWGLDDIETRKQRRM